MDYRTIQVTPCSPVIGAEIRGVDLRQPLSDDQWSEVLDAFHRHSVIFFRDQQPMTPEQQVAFGKRFGPLHIHPAAPHMEGHPEVFVIHAHKDSKIANGEFWHSDVSCDAEPPLARSSRSICSRRPAATRSSRACTRRTTISRRG